MNKRFLFFLPFNVLYPHLFELLVLLHGWKSFREHRRLFYKITFYFLLLNLPLFFVHVMAVAKAVSNPALAYAVHVSISMISSLIYWRMALPLFMKEKGRVFLDRRRTGTAETFATVTLILVGTVALAGYATLKIKIANEICRVIDALEGSVIKSETVRLSDSPFDRSGSGNAIYKITYRKAGGEFVAWYRSILNPINIHENAVTDYDEKWIFEEK